MKTIKLLLVILFFITGSVNAQSLLDIYKTGSVKLVADNDFGATNDWSKIFERHKKLINGTRMNIQISLLVLPDGSFVVKDSNPYYFTKFSPEGEFENEFSIKNNIEMMMRPHLFCVAQNEILLLGTSSNNKLYCTDLQGNFIKLLNLGYMAGSVIALPNKKLAIAGKANMGSIVDIITIKDYETAEEKIIWKTDTDLIEKKIKNIELPNPNGGKTSVGIGGFGQNIGLTPFPVITLTNNNEILLCIPSTGELIFFNLNGERLRTSKVIWKNEQIPKEEKEILYQQRINKIKNLKNKNSIIERYGKEGAKIFSEKGLEQLEKDKEFLLKPEELPYFSTIIQDSDHNILFFQYPKEEGSNQFNVYTLNGEGKFICKSSFVCDDYNLVINSDRLVFKDGFLYGVQELKDKSGIPMRLVKFSLQPAN